MSARVGEAQARRSVAGESAVDVHPAAIPPADRAGLTSRARPAWDRWLFALVAVGTMARLAYVMAAPMIDVIYRSTDDSYYYFNVARNIVLGYGPTFDGVNATNGFHPLWMLCLLPVYALFPADPDLALRAAFGLVTVVAGVGFWVAYRAMTRFASPVAAALATLLLAAPVLLNTLLNGLETGLLILVLFATIGALAGGRLLSARAGLADNLSLGVLLGLVFLARLDAAFLILGILGYIVYRSLRGLDGPPRMVALAAKLLQVGFASALLVIPYLWWNLSRFGHAVPISGELKTSFPVVSFTWSYFGFGSPHIALGTILLALPGFGLLWLGSRRPACAPGLLVAIWLGCALHFAYTLLFVHWAAHWWHFGSYLPLALVVSALVIDRLWSAPRWGRAVALAAPLVTIALGAAVDQRMHGGHHPVLYEAALWSRQNLPENAVVGMTDSGIFGYFCGRRTVNLDGVINGYEYQAALRDHRLGEYLARCGVTHFADYEVQYRRDRYLVRLPARLYRGSGGAIVATPAAEIYRSEPYSVPLSRRGALHFAIWDMPRLQVLDDVRLLNTP